MNQCEKESKPRPWSYIICFCSICVSVCVGLCRCVSLYVCLMSYEQNSIISYSFRMAIILTLRSWGLLFPLFQEWDRQKKKLYGLLLYKINKKERHLECKVNIIIFKFWKSVKVFGAKMYYNWFILEEKSLGILYDPYSSSLKTARHRHHKFEEDRPCNDKFYVSTVWFKWCPD